MWAWKIDEQDCKTLRFISEAHSDCVMGRRPFLGWQHCKMASSSCCIRKRIHVFISEHSHSVQNSFPCILIFYSTYLTLSLLHSAQSSVHSHFCSIWSFQQSRRVPGRVQGRFELLNTSPYLLSRRIQQVHRSRITGLCSSKHGSNI